MILRVVSHGHTLMDAGTIVPRPNVSYEQNNVSCAINGCSCLRAFHRNGTFRHSNARADNLPPGGSILDACTSFLLSFPCSISQVMRMTKQRSGFDCYRTPNVLAKTAACTRRRILRTHYRCSVLVRVTRTRTAASRQGPQHCHDLFCQIASPGLGFGCG